MKASPIAAAVSAVATPVARTGRAASHDRAIAYWLLFCCAMIFAMVVLGGVTRLTQSGVSITEWQPVTGIVPPLSRADWLAEFAKYQQIPQFKEINASMSLTQFKTIFLWEYAHRLLGRLIGVVYLLPFLYFLARGHISRRLAWPLAGILALGGAQGALGWWMVESGLVHRVEVSQYRLVAHLALALAIYAATLWIALDLFRTSLPLSDPPPLAGEGRVGAWQRAGDAIVALVALTICAGGFTAGLHAGLIYNTFPLMDGHIIPAGYAQLQPLWRNWFENVAAVQFDHRLLAETTFAAIAVLWVVGRWADLPPRAVLALHALFAAAILQFGLGVSALVLVVPIVLAAAHQAGAVLLLTTAIVFRHTLRARRLDLASAAAI